MPQPYLHLFWNCQYVIAAKDRPVATTIPYPASNTFRAPGLPRLGRLAVLARSRVEEARQLGQLRLGGLERPAFPAALLVGEATGAGPPTLGAGHAVGPRERERETRQDRRCGPWMPVRAS